jgi:hypothetical protein
MLLPRAPYHSDYLHKPSHHPIISIPMLFYNGTLVSVIVIFVTAWQL